MRIVFLGTPSDAVPSLHALGAAGHDIALVLTQPDRRRGRGVDLVPSPVKSAALELGLPVLAPRRAKEVVDDVGATGAELGVVAAFGQLLPPALLDALPLGFINVHFSLLPRWRGAAPVERAILAGDAETGVCIMALEAGLDTGPVYARVSTTIGAHETAGELHGRLVELGTDLLVATLPSIGTATPEPQAGEPTYAEKLTVEEFELDWSRPAMELARLVRAGNPKPGAWTHASGKRLKVLRAHPVDGEAPAGAVVAPASVGSGRGLLALDEVQPEGKRPMNGIDWVRGVRPAGRQLG
ncbi:MAG TPA: methionyl-tRNA formyltransferase [Acidimicrobiia bacterium]|nr:methionyl-tRNA formyltransferase [Acidimicrobiia bacterium]